jgi:formylmethanofuran dehydrogenase subunit E
MESFEAGKVDSVKMDNINSNIDNEEEVDWEEILAQYYEDSEDEDAEEEEPEEEEEEEEPEEEEEDAMIVEPDDWNCRMEIE